MNIRRGFICYFAVLLLGVRCLNANPVFSTTIDFLDYCGYAPFFDTPEGSNHPYLPLSVYEQYLKAIAEAGIKKLYFRSNICGLAQYPTKLSNIYSRETGGHWTFRNEDTCAIRFYNTCQNYNPLEETIRIGHKYGMEVWGWDSLQDDGCSVYNISDAEIIKRYGHYPLMDPYFRSRYGCFSQIRPDKSYDALYSKVNQETAGCTIGKIAFVSGFPRKGKLCRLSKENLRILTSVDNLTFTPYAGAYEFSATQNDDGIWAFVLDKLDIRCKYVKIAHTGFPESEKDVFSWVLLKHGGESKVYDPQGKPLPAIWGGVSGADPAPNTESLIFHQRITPMAFDYRTCSIGFSLGAPEKWKDDDYQLGLPEFSVPDAVSRKLQKFEELTSYSFDGFIVNNRTHTNIVQNADDYGFNPETRQAYLKKYGEDIWAASFQSIAKLQELRADFIDDYFSKCKKLTNGRPFFITMPEPRLAGGTFPKQTWWDSRGSLPWHVDKWLKEGIADGVTMIGWQNPKYIADRMPAGRKIDISRFLEGAYYVEDIRDLKEFQETLTGLCKDPLLNEIELYETLVFNKKTEFLDCVRQFTGK